jgi:hypothetical protein
VGNLQGDLKGFEQSLKRKFLEGFMGKRKGVEGLGVRRGWEALVGVKEGGRLKERGLRRFVSRSGFRDVELKLAALRKLIDWKRYFDQRELYWRWKLDK